MADQITTPCVSSSHALRVTFLYQPLVHSNPLQFCPQPPNFVPTQIGHSMPRKRPKLDPTRRPPLELTDDLKRRYMELDTPTDTSMSCIACGYGIGIRKKRTAKGHLVCLPCVATLKTHPYANDRFVWQQRRLTAFRDYLTGTLSA